jgi:hypothetical protein
MKKNLENKNINNIQMKQDIINLLKNETTNKTKKKSLMNFLKNLDKDLDFENPKEVFDYFSTLNKAQSTTSVNFGIISFCIGKLTGSVYEEGKNSPIEFSDLHRRYNELYMSSKRKIQEENPLKQIDIIEPPIVNDSDSNEVKYEKFVLKLFLDYPPLRKTDYEMVDLKCEGEDRNYYKEGVFYFNKLVKVNRKVEIVLNDNDRELFEKIRGDRVYLLKNKNFCLESVSLKHCGQSVCFMNLRTMYLTRKNEEYATNGKSFHSNLKDMINICSQMNTGIEDFLKYYCRNE